MRKGGFPISISGWLILTIIAVIALAALLLLYVFPVLIPQVLAFLEDIGLISTREPTALEQAILCSYYRCTEGCDSSKLEGLEFPAPPDGNYISCKEKFCDNVPADYKENNKICGYNAEQYPVEIEVSKEMKVSKKILDIGLSCIATSNSWFRPISNIGNKNFLFIKDVLLGDFEIETCQFPIGNAVNDAIKDEATISDNAFIYTYYGVPPIGGTFVLQSALTISLDDETLYMLKVGVEKEIEFATNAEYPTGFSSGPTYRVFVKDDYIISEAFLTLNEYDAVWGSTLKFSLKVGDTTKDEEFYEGDTKSITFDSQTYTLTLTSLGVGSVKFKIKYTTAPPVGVELFENPNFEGKKIVITGDDSDLTDNFFDNIASSIKLPEGKKTTLYEEKDFKGKNITISGNSSFLGLGDSVDSIKIEGPTGCEVTLYEHEEYGGKSKTITSNIAKLYDETTDAPCCRSTCFIFCVCTRWCWSDVASSIKVKDGCKATLYEDPEYAKRNVTVSGESSTLHFDDKTSSLK